MAIFSEEFTASVQSKVDAVKTKLSGVTKLGVGTLVVGGIVGSTVLLASTAATARHVVGSNYGAQCKIASDEYVSLANAQERDLSKMNSLMDQVVDNPWAMLGLSGPLTVTAERIGDRWDDINSAEDAYLDQCVPDSDFQQFAIGGYVEEERSAKWEAEYEMDKTFETTTNLMDRLGWGD